MRPQMFFEFSEIIGTARRKQPNRLITSTVFCAGWDYDSVEAEGSVVSCFMTVAGLTFTVPRNILRGPRQPFRQTRAVILSLADDAVFAASAGHGPFAYYPSTLFSGRCASAAAGAATPLLRSLVHGINFDFDRLSYYLIATCRDAAQGLAVEHASGS